MSLSIVRYVKIQSSQLNKEAFEQLQGKFKGLSLVSPLHKLKESSVELKALNMKKEQFFYSEYFIPLKGMVL